LLLVISYSSSGLIIKHLDKKQRKLMLTLGT
jgi:hypothetical protein